MSSPSITSCVEMVHKLAKHPSLELLCFGSSLDPLGVELLTSLPIVHPRTPLIFLNPEGAMRNCTEKQQVYTYAWFSHLGLL